jgi:hypothetical protein
MPLRILKDEIKALEALAFIYALVKYVVEYHPSIVTKFNDKWENERNNASLQ